MWAGPLGKQVKGLFYGAPSHDVPALIAFLTILITTVNFVVSVEVNFYPKYRNYYSLFNDGGTIKDIMQAGTEMLDVLNRELKYTALKQLLTTALAISMGESLLKYLPLGFNDLMYGYFRTLCVGYGIYAVANTMLLLLLYFTDYRGALAASVIFAVGTSVFTVISLFCPQVYYGFGFLAGCVLFYFIVMIRLERYTRRLPYYILSIQPVVAEDKSGVLPESDILWMRNWKGERTLTGIKKINLISAVLVSLSLCGGCTLEKAGNSSQDQTVQEDNETEQVKAEKAEKEEINEIHLRR